MISVLFLTAEIHSTTNLKTYEQAKNLFNPGNTQSSSEESLTKNVMRLSLCVPFSLGSIRKYRIYVIDDTGVFTTLSNI